MHNLDFFWSIFPYLIPIIIIQVGLMVFCLIDLIRREHTSGPKWLWGLVIVFGELIGPIIYLFFGRRE